MIVGTEWLIEATGCNAATLRDEATIRSIMSHVIDDLGLQTVGSVWHKFEGEGGVTGLIALTESHLACHTYPEHGIATFNLYCCRTRPEWNWEENLKEAIGATHVSVTQIGRGRDVPKRKFVSYGEVTIRNRGRLPHWEKNEGIYFVTFRLADSLPQHVLEQLEYEKDHAEKVLAQLDRELSTSEKRKLDWLFSEKVDAYLDKNYGGCELRNPEVASIVADALLHFDSTRYHLYAWCVMPNHVHVAFKSIQRHGLENILHSWKSFTAKEINKQLNRTGEFWQREYYDHLVRNESELHRIIKYIMDNPTKAGLKDWKWAANLVRQKAAEAG